MKQGWEIRRLEEICLRITDGSHFSPKEDLNGKYPMLSVKDMGVTCFSYDNCKHINEDDYKTLVANGCKPSIDDVLVAKDGSYLKTAFVQRVEKEQVILSSIAILTPNKTILNPDFLAFFFKSHHTKDIVERNYLTGTAIKRVILKGFRKISLSVPPIAEQEKIVAELDCLSGIIEKKKQQLKELDNLAQSIFYEMFGDPVENDKGWEKKRLEEIGEIIAGSTPSTADETNWDGDINWVTPAELGVQLYYGETVRKITEKAAKSLTLMPVGTVLLSTRAPIGKIAITTVPMCCNQGFKNIICNECINNVFLYYYLMLTMDNIKALGRGATFKEVSKKNISEYKVIIPDLDKQKQFASKIETIEKQKELLAQSIKETETLFNSRMDYYFN